MHERRRSVPSRGWARQFWTSPSPTVVFAARRPHLAGSDRAVAQFGSALHWGCRGRRFKSCQPDRVMSQDICKIRTDGLGSDLVLSGLRRESPLGVRPLLSAWFRVGPKPLNGVTDVTAEPSLGFPDCGLVPRLRGDAEVDTAAVYPCAEVRLGPPHDGVLPAPGQHRRAIGRTGGPVRPAQPVLLDRVAPMYLHPRRPCGAEGERCRRYWSLIRSGPNTGTSSRVASPQLEQSTWSVSERAATSPPSRVSRSASIARRRLGRTTSLMDLRGRAREAG